MRKNELFSRFSSIIIDKKIGIISDVLVFPKKFFFSGKVKDADILFGKVIPNGIDDTERKILGQLFHNSRIRMVDLAKNTGSTIDVVRNRMNRLEDAGVIVKYSIAIDYRELGMEFYKSFLYFENFDEKNEKKLIGFCKAHPNILNVIRQISPWDVELEIMVLNYSEYNRIMHQLRKLFPHELRNVESAIMSEDYVFPAKKTIFD
jgi:DNA-binding Lrp family transcriptional regulator